LRQGFSESHEIGGSFTFRLPSPSAHLVRVRRKEVARDRFGYPLACREERPGVCCQQASWLETFQRQVPMASVVPERRAVAVVPRSATKAPPSEELAYQYQER
jgi:hypothetical protein